MEQIRLIMLVESRIRGDVYVRFGGEYPKTCHSNMIRRWVLSLLQETVKIYQQGKEYYDGLRKVKNLVRDARKVQQNYDGLRKVKNLVRDARKVQQTILMVGDITEIYVTSYERMLSDPYFTPEELSAIALGYTKRRVPIC